MIDNVTEAPTSDLQVWLEQIQERGDTYRLLILSLQAMKMNPNQSPREALMYGVNEILG